MSLFDIRHAFLKVEKKKTYSPDVLDRVITLEESDEPVLTEQGETMVTEGSGG